ncbi:hypothetical protein D4A39_00015 [Alcanivorax profundi]|uniref:TIGR02391 family protein n=1 Tax=Alcanivorax profundi TaxID=2338368 RepID=A0A418Y185_9GAMM|nr:hypothetical protein [Alcanivorax profundi]RJG19294.1 hypothetical protein D4A39_00015 [Alcanivorax profundi]
MEEFKEFDKLEHADERNLHWCIFDPESGHSRQITKQDFYSALSAITLNEKVPNTVLSQFNIAKNIAIYSWNCYSFHQVCEMKVYSTLEYALKDRLEKQAPFPRLIRAAISRGLVMDKGFSHIKTMSDKDPTEYCRTLANIMPKLRNSLAHGGSALHPGSLSTLIICAEFINQIYLNQPPEKYV